MTASSITGDPMCQFGHGPLFRHVGAGVSWWVCPQCSVFQPGPGVSWEWTVTESLESLVAAAHAAGVVVYDDPHTLNYEVLEPGVRVACRRINESGWCFTAESCHGHVHEDTRWGGSWGDEPFLRLTTRQKHFGYMLALFARAMTFNEVSAGGTPRSTIVEERTLSFTVYPDTRGEPEFGSTIIRIPCGRVYTRRLALEAFERFGELVNAEKP